MKARWYEKTGVIILFLILFFPIGLFLMWKYGKWNKSIKITVTVLLVVGCIGAISGGSSETNVAEASKVESKSTEPRETSKALESEKPKVPEKTPDEIEKEYKQSCETFIYKDIERNPSNFENITCMIKGKVIQVNEGAFSFVTLRVATKENEYSAYTNDVYMVTYKQTDENRILEEDMVTIWGECMGVSTYKSVLNGNITIPSIEMKYYKIEK